MFKKNTKSIISKSLVILMIIMTLLSYMPAGISPLIKNAEAAEDDSINNLINEAIKNNCESYMSGTPVDVQWGNFSSYDIYILAKAGTNFINFKYEGLSLAERAEILIDETIANEGTPASSNSKRVAQDYITAEILGETEKAAVLLNILKDRQKESGEFDQGDYTIYNNLPAYDLLARSDVLTKSGISIDNAVIYILDNQDTTGAWPWPTEFNDFMVTNQAVRVLKAAENYSTVTPSAIQSAIDSGVTWLKSNQQDDGSFVAGYDDAVTDTSEMIYTLIKLGENPMELKSSKGNSSTDFMMKGAYINGSFGNVTSTTWALDAYMQLKAIGFTGEENNSDSGTDKPVISPTETFKVNVAVIGKDGEVIYGPRKVSVSSSDKYGATALGALDATGLDCKIIDIDGLFVKEIDGQENEGMSGWMYAVNGKVPSVSASLKAINKGDEILWWYSTSAMVKAPAWPDSSTGGTIVTNPNPTMNDLVVAVIDTEKRISFDDVDDSLSWARDAIEILAGNGIIDGTGSGFEPHRSITRAEFIKIIVKALNLETKEASGDLFDDVDESEWFTDFIECAFENKIIAGDPDGKFRPNDVISRNEIAVILSRIIDKEKLLENYDLWYQDTEDIPEWAEAGVKFVLKANLMKGYEDNSFKGTQPLTRAEAAVVIYRYLTNNF